MLSEKERLEFCKQCQKRKFDKSTGIVCSLTNAKPTFTDTCSHYLIDSSVEKQLARSNKDIGDFSVGESKPMSKWQIVLTVLLVLLLTARIVIAIVR
jgi:hypothetical protein